MPRTTGNWSVLGVAMVGNEVRHVRTSLVVIVNAVRGHPVAEFLVFELDVGSVNLAPGPVP